MEKKDLTTGTAENLRPAPTEGEEVREKMIGLLKNLMAAERSLPDDDRTLPVGFDLEGSFKLYDPQKYRIKFNKNSQSGEYWTMWLKGKGKHRGVCSIVILLPSRNREKYPDQIKVRSEAHFRQNYEYSPVKKEAA
jgi:hypothetical protein